jgi:inorganic pyrophosphatase/exopolyphosphatase
MIPVIAQFYNKGLNNMAKIVIGLTDSVHKAQVIEVRINDGQTVSYKMTGKNIDRLMAFLKNVKNYDRSTASNRHSVVYKMTYGILPVFTNKI